MYCVYSHVHLTKEPFVQNVFVYWQIHLTQEQLQAIQLQMQGKQPGQAIVVQTQPGSQDADQEVSQQVGVCGGCVRVCVCVRM